MSIGQVQVELRRGCCRFTITCLRACKETHWRGRPDLTCRTSLAQQCMPTPTVGRIRMPNQWVRRARQFADLLRNLHSAPHRSLVDSPGRDWTNPSRVHHCCNRPSVDWKSHKLELGCTFTLAGDAKVLSSGLGHVERVTCTFATARLCGAVGVCGECHRVGHVVIKFTPEGIG